MRELRRAYDTNRIPPDQYEQIRKLSLRYRLVPVLFGALIALLAIFFTLTGNIFGVFFLLPVGADLVVRLPAPAAPQALPRGDQDAAALGAARGLRAAAALGRGSLKKRPYRRRFFRDPSPRPPRRPTDPPYRCCYATPRGYDAGAALGAALSSACARSSSGVAGTCSRSFSGILSWTTWRQT